MTAHTELTATEAIVSFATSGEPSAVDHRDDVARALVDTIAVTIGAAGSDGERIVRRWALGESPDGAATVWTTGARTTAAAAALVNGTAAHLLDYDDISPSMPLHPSAVLMPALVAVAETRNLGGGRFVEAYDVGAAVFRALAEVLPQHVHYARGWHTTSTVGRLAAVAAIVRLVGADEGVARHSLGVVASLAAGSRANFGSMTKPLHAGAAARDAIMAVELAEAGFTANTAELDAAAGFLERYGDLDAGPVGSAAQTLEERLEYWVDVWPHNWGLKRYPSCYGTHRGIDAMLALRDEIGDAEPTAIRATLHPRGTRPLRTAPPATGTEAKFSLEYTLAVALRRGEVLLDDFTDETFAGAGADVRDLMPRVTVTESEVPPQGPADYAPGYTVVEVEFADRPLAWARVEVTHGVSSDPLTDDELRAKVVDCLAAGGLTDDSAALADELIAAVRAEPGPAFTSVIPNRSHA